MTAPESGQAVYEAMHRSRMKRAGITEPDYCAWEALDVMTTPAGLRREDMEAAAVAGHAAIAAAAPAPQAAPAVTVEALTAALDGREIVVTVGNGWERRQARDPRALAGELLGAIDSRLTDEPQPQAAPELAAARRETRAVAVERDKYLNWLDDFTRVVLDVSDRAGLMRAAASLRKKAGFEP